MKPPVKNINRAKPLVDNGEYKPLYTLTEPIVALVAQIADGGSSK